MASLQVKGKRRVKGKTLNLTTFLGEDQDAPTGFAVVNTARRLDWADAMENEDLDDRYTLDFKKDEKLVLPTAPKAARGPDVDLGKVPTRPPYTAFLGNLPYDVSEEDIASFFTQLQVTNIRLPRENGDKGRIRGFGYAEFHDRQDLIQALALNNESLKNRAIKVTLAEEHDNERGGRDGGGGSDRTLGDWRSEKKDFSRDEPPRNDNPRGFTDREPYRGRSSYEKDFTFSRDRPERNGDRFERNDRDFGRNQDQRYERRQNDRGYGFSSDKGMSRGGRSDQRDGGRDFRDNYGRREESNRDFRYRDSADPPRESFDRRPPERPSYDQGGADAPKERRKLQLQPRTKPIEPTPPPSEATASSIFGGAKPVDTAAKEREIEERLEREKEGGVRDTRESDDPRTRRYSTGSGVSNRSRRSSDSGPPDSLKDEAESVPTYKPPMSRQPDCDTQQFNTLPKTRQRCSSNSSTGSDNQTSTKTNLPPTVKKENHATNSESKDVASDMVSGTKAQTDDADFSYVEPAKAGHRNAKHNHSQRDDSRESASQGVPYEEPKPVVYTSANKFSHLMNDAEDFEQDSE